MWQYHFHMKKVSTYEAKIYGKKYYIKGILGS